MGIEIIGGSSLNLGPRRGALRFLSGGGEVYLLRDLFQTARAAGAINNTPTEPGGTGTAVQNTRTVTDAESKLTIAAGGVLTFAGGKASPGYGDPGLWDGAFTRQAGLSLRGYYTVQAGAGAEFLAGFGSAQSGLVSRPGFYYTASNNPITFQLYDAAGYTPLGVIQPIVAGTQYEVCVVVAATGGGFLLVRGGIYTNWTLFDVGRLSVSDPIYPGVGNRSSVLTVKDMRVKKLLGVGWSTQFGIAVNRTATPTSPAATVAPADSLVEFTWTPAAGETLELDLRRTDADNRWIVRCVQAGGSINLIERKAGVEIVRGVSTKTQTWTASTAYRIQAWMDNGIIATSVDRTAKTYYQDCGVNVNAMGVMASGFTTGANLIAWPRRCSSLDYFSAAITTLTLTSPQSYQIFQRSGTTGTIAISGAYNGAGSHDIEARWNGGAWATIASSVTQGAFSGSLASQAQGQGTLEIRLVDDTSVTASASSVGIGDVFIVAGQSNAVGQATSNQTWTHPTLKAGMFAKSYQWRELSDPLSDVTNQIDRFHRDATYGGTVWVKLATSIMATTGVPVAFVPCAADATGINDWLLTTADHYYESDAYGCMARRIRETGAVCVLFWQGESDAIAGTVQATYNTKLDTLANVINTDFGIKLMPCKLQHITSATQGNQDAINAAIGDAWVDNVNVLPGPDLTGLDAATLGDGIHIKTDAGIASAASLWWAAIQVAFGW